MKKKNIIILSAVALVVIAALTILVIAFATADDDIGINQAREIAQEFVQGGVAGEVRAFTENDVLMFEVEVISGEDTYKVLVNGETGTVVSMNRVEEAAEDVPTPTEAVTEEPEQTTALVTTAPPTTRATTQRPRTTTRRTEDGNQGETAISRDRAIELARNHLNAIGAGDARLEYAYLDWEDGRRVWSVEFEQGDRDFEFYVDAQTGNFLKSP